MSEEFVAVEEHGAVAVVRIDRPSVHNALNAALLRRLGEEIGTLAGKARAIVLTGTGEKAFSAGADLDELATLDAEAAHPVMRAGQEVIRRIERSPVPVLAAVNGLALGGGFELVLACSFAVVSRKASFGLPEAGLGLIPGYGGTQRLARVTGPHVARHVMLTGSRIDAERAYQLGLAVLPPVEPGELLPAALEVANTIAAKGPGACRAILEAVDRGQDMPLDAGLALETGLAALAIGGTESDEGVAAFKGKRAPEFGDLA
ncbi:enoyl-CoA hydratase/isomerase family protein [Amycolatopsis acidicola]|uniref:enoyl-CoA hydratase n=1 Tax=Amycolatopsis acidicola TaxID=2596893 RepID=A0A5N0VDB3_9PSEU|nr:enoyl-CoA hydratase-related protein [Amycolatopsis acidicola]KAA9162652.1 enoyl-CoA hydratase/isomerase family protein [Amycolatopsis acidicola]